MSVIGRVVHGTYLSVLFPSHSNLCLSHPMGRFPWDSHRNPIHMDKPGNRTKPHEMYFVQAHLPPFTCFDVNMLAILRILS